MTSWSLQDAKNKLSKLVDTALEDGPQMITRHGRPTVVVLSMEKFEQMAPRETLADILQECPVKGWGVDRSEDTARDFLLQ